MDLFQLLNQYPLPNDRHLVILCIEGKKINKGEKTEQKEDKKRRGKGKRDGKDEINQKKWNIILSVHTQKQVYLTDNITIKYNNQRQGTL